MRILESPLTRKLSAFVALSDVDLDTLARFHRRRRTFLAGHQMIAAGERHASAFILAQGWACAFKVLPDGERQIVDYQIPGDFLGLRSILFRTADHSSEAVTRIEASEVLATDLFDSFAQAPAWPPPCSGRPRATRRWWWNIWSISGAAPPRSGWRICCWNWARGCGWWDWAARPAMTVR